MYSDYFFIEETDTGKIVFHGFAETEGEALSLFHKKQKKNSDINCKINWFPKQHIWDWEQASSCAGDDEALFLLQSEPNMECAEMLVKPLKEAGKWNSNFIPIWD